MQLTRKGEQQEGRVGKPLEPFEILAQEEGGDRLPHVPVEFVVAEGTGTFTYKDEITDQGGNAIAEFVPTTAGRYRVECFIGEDKREMVPFKGVIAADRRKRKSRPPAPKKPVATPEAAVPQPVVPSAILAAGTQPAAAPTEVPPAPAVTAPAKAVTPRSVPAQVLRRPAKPSRARPAGASPPPPSGARGLLIAVIVIFALLAAFTVALVVQDLARPQPVVECSGDSWRLTGTTMIFPKCITTMR